MGPTYSRHCPSSPSLSVTTQEGVQYQPLRDFAGDQTLSKPPAPLRHRVWGFSLSHLEGLDFLYSGHPRLQGSSPGVQSPRLYSSQCCQFTCHIMTSLHLGCELCEGTDWYLFAPREPEQHWAGKRGSGTPTDCWHMVRGWARLSHTSHGEGGTAYCLFC